MVADKVEVISKKAGQKSSWHWISDGKTGYDIEKGNKNNIGTKIIIHLNDEGKEYASRWSIENIIKKY